jgi:hypothetical protein
LILQKKNGLSSHLKKTIYMLAIQGTSYKTGSPGPGPDSRQIAAEVVEIAGLTDIPAQLMGIQTIEHYVSLLPLFIDCQRFFWPEQMLFAKDKT